MNDIIKEINVVAESGILPDGDGILTPTMLWLEDLVGRAKSAVQPVVSQPGGVGSKGGPKIIGVDEIAEIIQEYTIATDEWGGEKLANWEYGHNVCVGGIDEAAEEIHKKLAGE